MKKWIILIVILVLGLGLEVGINISWTKNINNLIIIEPKKFEYLKYGIGSLGQRPYTSDIIMDELVSEGDKYQVYKYHFDSDGEKVTGLAHIPKDCSSENKCPVIVQYRGYADPKVYVPGYGTQHSAQKFANNGFISLAPDFLGYGGSDKPADDVWVERFETYTTAANLLAGVSKWSYSNGKMGIWGHSNGGNISLTTLEIAGKDYPTVIWAPVSVYFPYSVLYYTDDNDDEGVALRKQVQRLESDYNLQMFSLSDHLEKIRAPILLQQGTADDLVPQKWSEALFNKLKNLNVDISYEVYPGADHNLTPGWDKVTDSDLNFYNKFLK